jgi:phage baseplate assembly protein W
MLTLKPLIGWPLLPRPTGGSLQWPTLERSVRELIRVILSTQPGEQLMRPLFGAGLQRFLHEGNTLTTRQRIQDAITGALGNYENRISVERIDVDPIPGAPAQIGITISYRLLRTGVIEQVTATVTSGA